VQSWCVRLHKSRNKNPRAAAFINLQQKLHAAHGLVCLLTHYIVTWRVLLYFGIKPSITVLGHDSERAWSQRMKEAQSLIGRGTTSYGVRYQVTCVVIHTRDTCHALLTLH
jgi:hypothetical protein